MIYLDASLFVIAAVDSGEKGFLAQRIVEFLNINRKETVTSLLTFDEVVYAVRKFKGFESSILAGEAFLSTNVLFSDVTRNVIGHSVDVMRQYQFKPRDSIHLATMKAYGVKEILSEDSDFDRVKGIKRLALKEFLMKI